MTNLVALALLVPCLSASETCLAQQQRPKPRARDLGIPFEGRPGPFNAITDVRGVEVGYTTLISGEGKLMVGRGPVRSGVTAVLPLGIGVMGGRGENSSGDIFIGFSTANPEAARTTGTARLTMLPNERIDPLLSAAVGATEEAIVNAMIAAETMRGIDGNTVYAIPHDRLRDVLKKYNRLKQ
jgi:L-aminopeptidase/D-esterase-like protein